MQSQRADGESSAGLSCRHFGRCGGCIALGSPPARQLERKAARVSERTAPWRGDVELEWEAHGSARFYRTKLLYPAQPAGRRGLALGLYARGTHDIERIRECQIQHPALTELGRRAEAVFRELGLRAWDERARRGDVRALHARITPDTGEVLIGVVTREGDFPASGALAERLVDAARQLPALRDPRPRAVGVVRNLNQAEGNALLGAQSLLLAGRAYQEDVQDGLRFRIGFGSFYQLHRNASEILYRPALALCGDVEGARVVDGYGGIGTFGLRLAAAGAAEVSIVEASAPACADAAHNARCNGLEGVRVERAPFANASFAERPDLMLVDPPRAGLLQPGVARVLAAAPARLLHVACSDASLARDLAGLTAGGYRVRAMQLVDLFPYTEHVEVLTLLTR
jgi:23S rRNA (uracil1939-C5)-methyltransferase